PGPPLLIASGLVIAAARWALEAWSIVVVLNSSVQLSATVSTIGVLADEKRRVAAARFAEARKPPTGDSADSAGASSRPAACATTGPRNPTARTRQMAVS